MSGDTSKDYNSQLSIPFFNFHMSRLRTTIILTLFAALFAACKNGDNSGAMRFTLEGTLANAANKMLYIEEMTPDYGAQFVDSIKCDRNGHFSYKGSMGYETFFNLHSSEYDFIVLLPGDGETVTLSGDANDLSTSYRVEGSEESQLMWQIQSYINDAKHTIADIAQRDRYNRDNLSDAEYEKAKRVTDSIFLAEHKTVYMMFYNFIEENLGSLTTLYAIDAPFNHSARVFYAEADFEVFEDVLAGLQETYPNNPHTLYFQTRVERARSTRAIAQQQQQSGQEFIIE